MQGINDARKTLISAIGATTIIYGLFLIVFVFWKSVAKSNEWIQSDLIFIVPQFIYGFLFLIGGIGACLINNKFRILLILTAISKLIFILLFMGTFSSICAHVAHMSGTYPLALTHDVFSTALSVVLVIFFTNRNVLAVFTDGGIKQEVECKIKWYGALSAILFIISVANVVPDKVTFFGLANSISSWAFLFVTWRLIVNALATRN